MSSVLVISSCALPGFTKHQHELSGEIGILSMGTPPEQLSIRVRGNGPYGVVRSDPIALDSEGRFSLRIEDGYCETVWIFPPLSFIHSATWWIPLEWLPILGPLLIGPRTYPLSDIALEVLMQGKPIHEAKIEPMIIREGRYKLRYEIGRITFP